MKCPACKGPLHRKTAGGMILDVCYGGCGGIWFDKDELEHMDPRASISLPALWRNPQTRVSVSEPRICPRCQNQLLSRKSFSELVSARIDQCPNCGGFWLDEDEFVRIRKTSGGAAMALWALAMPDTATFTDTRKSP
jgi:uncharacterized protein